MSLFNDQSGDADCFNPSSNRFFAARALELLPIRREVIHASRPVDDNSAGVISSDTFFKKPHDSAPASTWWSPMATTCDSSLGMATAQQLLLQPCFPWPLMTMSPMGFGSGGADPVPTLPELLMSSSSPSSFSAPMVSAPPTALLNLPPLSLPLSMPHVSLPMSAPMAMAPDDELFARISEHRACGQTWQDISEALVAASAAPENLSPTQLSYLFYRRLSSTQPPSLPMASPMPHVTSQRFAPYSAGGRGTHGGGSSTRRTNSISNSRQVRLAYLNVDQFKQLQRLIMLHGENDWDYLSGEMDIRAGDLKKNWVGYTTSTVITRTWSAEEIEMLAVCRAISISCRTTAKLIGTKLPLQCRRKTIKPAFLVAPTTVHYSADGGFMHLIAAKSGGAASHATDPHSDRTVVDRESLDVAREIIRTHVNGLSLQQSFAGVRHVLAVARAALPALSQQTVDMCVLSILSTHPSYEAGQHPATVRTSVPPVLQSSSPLIARTNPSPAVPPPGRTDGCTRWSQRELEILSTYVASNNHGKKDWRHVAVDIGTKTAAQCNNKYRSLRRYGKIV